MISDTNLEARVSKLESKLDPLFSSEDDLELIWCALETHRYKIGRSKTYGYRLPRILEMQKEIIDYLRNETPERGEP